MATAQRQLNAHPRAAPSGAFFAAGEDKNDVGEFPWPFALSFALLTYNTISAVRRSGDDLWAVSFLVAAYIDLLCLFWCLRQFERSSSESTKQKLKVAIWILATLLTGMFSCKVAAAMPLHVAVIVWCMGSATTIGGFYACFG